MEYLSLSESDFNKLSESELECFVMVTHDGSDQYVIDWNTMMETALDVISQKTGESEIDLSKYTNIEILDIYYKQSGDINGNNSELLFSQISRTDGCPKIKKLRFV